MFDSILRPVALPSRLMGHPAPCDFFDARGVLLLKAGAPIALRSEHTPQARRIFCKASYANRISPADPIAQLRDIADRLSALAEQVEYGEETVAQDYLDLARRLHEVWVLDADACIGYARLVHSSRPSVCQVVLAALLAAELGSANGLPQAALMNIIGAALTMNLASMALHDEMYELAGEPTPRMRDEIDLHPVKTLMLLQRIGPFPQEWLDAVAQHHENVDGSGYPWGLERAEIALAARILRVADTLAARLNGRRRRGPRYWNVHQTRDLPRLAQHVFGSDLERLDQTLVRLLMTRLTAFPPGTLLRLNTGDVAVVGRRAGNDPLAAPREVMTVIGGNGRALQQPGWRKIGPRDYRIQGCANDDLHRLPTYDWQSIWGYRH